MSRWFRHYAGMMRDEKLVRAAIKSGQSIERVIWVWGAILESAAEINDDGRFDFDGAEAAYFLRADEADISAITASLESGGRIAGDRVLRWGDRQFKSDGSAERVRKHRLAQGVRNGDDEQGPKESGRYSNEDVTLQKRSGNAPETETETEKKVSEANASGAFAPLATLDPKAILFDRGLPELSRLTDRPPAQLRPVLGRWLKLTANDAGAILAEIEKCRGSPVADPIAWIERQLKPQERTNGNTADSQHERNRRALASVVAKRSHAGGDAMVSAAFADPRQPQAIGYLEPGERPQGDARLRTG